MKYFVTLCVMLTVHFSLMQPGSKVINIASSNKHALVAGAQVIQEVKLNEVDMAKYAQHLLDQSGNVLDTVMFREIINNAYAIDTTAWKDEDLKGVLVIQKRDDNISKDYLFHKLNLSGKKQIRYYTRYVNRYNEMPSSDRNVYYFSKPVYSNSGKYAVVQWSNSNSGNSTGGIDLYYLDGSEWKEVGEVSSWNN